MQALTEAATRAPRLPGVYFLLGADRELLYIGKATDLQRRLRDHAHDEGTTHDVRRRVLLDAVDAVYWEECADDLSASAREADLIVMLRPAFNAAHAEQDPDHYVVVTPTPGSMRFELTGAPDRGRGYGTFPHLAKGATSTVAKRTKHGYTALLRLLWSASSGKPTAPIPARISGPSPPARFDAAVATGSQPLLHDFLSGRSARLLPALWETIVTSAIPAFTQASLQRDVDAAREFFELGPHHVRRFRLRHALPTGPVRADVMAYFLAAEVRESVGDFRRGTAAEGVEAFGRRGAREQQLHERMRH